MIDVRKWAHRYNMLGRATVFEFLYQNPERGWGPADIGKRTGIFREAGLVKKSGNDDQVWGILGGLQKAGRIKQMTQPNGKGGWQLTDQAWAERASIKDEDVSAWYRSWNS